MFVLYTNNHICVYCMIQMLRRKKSRISHTEYSIQSRKRAKNNPSAGSKKNNIRRQAGRQAGRYQVKFKSSVQQHLHFLPFLVRNLNCLCGRHGHEVRTPSSPSSSSSASTSPRIPPLLLSQSFIPLRHSLKESAIAVVHFVSRD